MAGSPDTRIGFQPENRKTVVADDLQAGDLVLALSDPVAGQRFLVTYAEGTFLGVQPATKNGNRDRRHLGWSGGFGGVDFELLQRRNPSPSP